MIVNDNADKLMAGATESMREAGFKCPFFPVTDCNNCLFVANCAVHAKSIKANKENNYDRSNGNPQG